LKERVFMEPRIPAAVDLVYAGAEKDLSLRCRELALVFRVRQVYLNQIRAQAGPSLKADLIRLITEREPELLELLS
jgi:hypothetical protein